ncbi:acetyl-CoA synthetase-like protein [Trametes maxima]|nr:acetyl-CoA synthetase-like protein [Trametes maxima]
MKGATNDIPTVHGDGGPLPFIPDDVTLPQFLFDTHHPLGGEPLHVRPSAWFIEDETGREVTGDEVRAGVRGVANAMHTRWNIAKDDVVCIFGPNHIDYPIVIWATHRLGGIVTGANPAYTADELVYQICTAKATVLFAHPDSLLVALEAAHIAGIPESRIALFDYAPGSTHITVHDLVKEGLTQPQGYVEERLKTGEGKEKLALLFFSSGTTGRPKAVLITHYSVIANIVQIKTYTNRHDAGKPISEQRYAPGDRVLGVLPLYHIYGVVVGLHFFLFGGATVVVVSRFNFENMLKSIERYRIAHLALVPPMVLLLCRHPAVRDYDLRSVKTTSSAAAPLSAELTLQVSRVLPNSAIGQGYGLTETCTALTLPPLFVRMGTPGSAGVLIPGVCVRIHKEDGTWGGFNETGEIVVTSPSVARGYLNSAEETKQTFRDGWVYTGDVGYVNEQKELFVVDRIKELIKVRGFQVAPAELEGLLLDHPDVADACVVGIPDEYSGELPFAFIVLENEARLRISGNSDDEEATRGALIKYVAERKTQYKWLAGVSFVDAIPKNPSGKLLRKVLRERLEGLVKSGGVRLIYSTRSRL